MDAGGAPIRALDLRAPGAMALLLRDALLPNLVQTLEGQPVLVHAGPFANIAHGASSILADRVAAGLADVVVTEVGFAADLGFEKLVDLKVPAGGFPPDAAVVVASVRALEAHGPTLDDGLSNLRAMLAIVRSCGVPAVVAVNRFEGDDPHEIEIVRSCVAEAGAGAEVFDGFARGGDGATDLARAVVLAAAQRSSLVPFQTEGASISDNLHTVATRVYGADGVDLSPSAALDLARLEAWGFAHLPVCVAKTPLSLSHDPHVKGAPKGFRVPVTGIELCAGAGFVVALCGDTQRMPGLPPHPRGEAMEPSGPADPKKSST
jgi:formate--tetrahydrofolate ligase